VGRKPSEDGADEHTRLRARPRLPLRNNVGAAGCPTAPHGRSGTLLPGTARRRHSPLRPRPQTREPAGIQQPLGDEILQQDEERDSAILLTWYLSETKTVRKFSFITQEPWDS